MDGTVQISTKEEPTEDQGTEKKLNTYTCNIPALVWILQTLARIARVN